MKRDLPAYRTRPSPLVLDPSSLDQDPSFWPKAPLGFALISSSCSLLHLDIDFLSLLSLFSLHYGFDCIDSMVLVNASQRCAAIVDLMTFDLRHGVNRQALCYTYTEFYKFYFQKRFLLPN